MINLGKELLRHQHKGKDLVYALGRSTNARKYYARATQLYEQYCQVFIESHGCHKERLKLEMERVLSKIELSSLMVDQNNPIAIHRDPPTVTAAGIFGRGNYKYESGEFRQTCNGGNLVIVDGMVQIDRSPLDFVIMDGNYSHAVSNLRHFSNSNEVLSRFSLILFSSYRREHMKAPGNYKIDFSHLS